MMKIDIDWTFEFTFSTSKPIDLIHFNESIVVEALADMLKHNFEFEDKDILEFDYEIYNAYDDPEHQYGIWIRFKVNVGYDGGYPATLESPGESTEVYIDNWGFDNLSNLDYHNLPGIGKYIINVEYEVDPKDEIDLLNKIEYAEYELELLARERY